MIVIIAYEDYPDKSPGSIRVKTFANAYLNFGYEVIVIHKGQNVVKKKNYEEISLYDTNRYIQYTYFSCRAIKKLKKFQKIEAVITYGVFTKVEHWCKSHNIIYVSDVVEWYSKEQFKHWYLSRAYWFKEREIRYLTKNRCRVICISSFLQNYFKNNGNKVVNIPIISEHIHSYQKQYENLNIIHLIYAGSHLLMDNIPLIIKSIAQLSDEERKHICLTIYGLKETAIQKYLTKEDIIATKDCLRIMGHRPNTEVLESYKSSHFTILLRDPSLRVNMAGFPSKIIESMGMGVPILGNYSSDLNKYLIDGENAVIVKELSVQKIVTSLRSLFCLTPEQMSLLRINALETIKLKFNPDLFKDQFINIIKD